MALPSMGSDSVKDRLVVELRLRLEACDIEPWDGTRAQAWWAEHRGELEAHPSQSSALAQTIAVDGAARS